MRPRGSALALRTASELPPTTTTTSKSSRRSWASLKEIWEPTMTPASVRTLGSEAAMVTSKALVAVETHKSQLEDDRAGTKKSKGHHPTWVVVIMEGRSQDLKGTSKVKHVELVVQGKEHINGLFISHCTRLGGHLGQLVGCGRGKKGRKLESVSIGQCRDWLGIVSDVNGLDSVATVQTQLFKGGD